MNKDIFIKKLKELGICINEEQLNMLDIYMNYLIEYNKHTNITAITDPKDIYLKHFYDSLTIVKAIDLNNSISILDVGSGAGFPGMVLKIMFPNLEIVLLDSNNKKIIFLKELSQKLNLNLNIVNMRVEDFAKDNLNKFDVVTSRAVANLRVLAELSIPLVKLNGYFIPMKGNLNETLENGLDTIELLNCSLEKQITFNLYNNDYIRNILVIKKLKKTNISELRSYDKIIKKPLKKSSK